MSRPSRGLTAEPRPASTPSNCPLNGSVEIQDLGAGDWVCRFTWTPDVLVADFIVSLQVNSGDWTPVYEDTVVHSGPQVEIFVGNYASPGDIISIKADCTGIEDCSDFVCGPVTQVYEV